MSEQDGQRPCRLPARPDEAAFEDHYTVPQVAKMWGFGVDKVRQMFKDEPGVIREGKGETMHKRGYISCRIPISVVRRVHARLTA